MNNKVVLGGSLMLTIENALLKVEIDEVGAQISHVIDKMGNFDYIWNGSQWPYHAPIKFPIIGKLNNQGQLQDKIDGINENGFAYDMKWTVVDKGDDRVSLTLTQSESTLEDYPYEFSLMVTYSLTGNQLQVDFYLKNTNSQAMPYSLGFAPTFNVPFIPDGTRLNFNNYELNFMPEVQTLSHLELTQEKFLTGKELPINDAIKSRLPLNYQEFKNGPILISNAGLTEVSLNSQNSEHQIQLTLEDFPYLAVSTLGEQETQFISIELMNGLPALSNQTNNEENNLKQHQVLPPDQEAKLTTNITFK